MPAYTYVYVERVLPICHLYGNGIIWYAIYGCMRVRNSEWTYWELLLYSVHKHQLAQYGSQRPYRNNECSNSIALGSRRFIEAFWFRLRIHSLINTLVSCISLHTNANANASVAAELTEPTTMNIGNCAMCKVFMRFPYSNFGRCETSSSVWAKMNGKWNMNENVETSNWTF